LYALRRYQVIEKQLLNEKRGKTRSLKKGNICINSREHGKVSKERGYYTEEM
jgi:hypothetical protein